MLNSFLSSLCWSCGRRLSAVTEKNCHQITKERVRTETDGGGGRERERGGGEDGQREKENVRIEGEDSIGDRH